MTAFREGCFDLAVLRSDVQHDAVTGRGPLAQPGAFTSLRAVLSAHAEPFALVVRADSDIWTAADLTRLHAAFTPLDPREMVRAGNRAPLHPGAERYDRERGWLQ